MKLSKVTSEDPREVLMRILNHPFIQAFLLSASICYRSDQELAKCTYKIDLNGKYIDFTELIISIRESLDMMVDKTSHI